MTYVFTFTPGISSGYARITCSINEPWIDADPPPFNGVAFDYQTTARSATCRDVATPTTGVKFLIFLNFAHFFLMLALGSASPGYASFLEIFTSTSWFWSCKIRFFKKSQICSRIIFESTLFKELYTKHTTV